MIYAAKKDNLRPVIQLLEPRVAFIVAYQHRKALVVRGAEESEETPVLIG